MNLQDNETGPGPLDEVYAAYLHALDEGASPEQLRDLQQRQRDQLARDHAGDPALLVALDDQLQRFYEAHAAVAGAADAFRTLPEGFGGPPQTGGAESPKRFGHYELLELLGKGGMGEVRKAWDPRMNRLVAIKRLQDHPDNPGHRARFNREVRAMGALRHQHVLQIYDVAEEEGEPYIVMEFAEGGSLAGYLRSLGLPDWGDQYQLPPGPAQLEHFRDLLLEEKQLRQSVELLAMLGRALVYLHGKGVLHRDLKPANILLQGEPGQTAHLHDPRIADFGLAKILGDAPSLGITEGWPGGTMFYAAPEQYQAGVPIDVRADVYGLGALLYEMLTGEPPLRKEYAASRDLARRLEVKRKEPPPPHAIDPRVPPDLNAICGKCLRSEPARRFNNAQELVEELERWLRHEPILTRTPTVIERWRSWFRREPRKAWGWTLSGAVGVFLVVALFWGVDARGKWALRTEKEAGMALDRARKLQGEARSSADEAATLERAIAAAQEADVIVKAGLADQSLRHRVTDVLRELRDEADRARDAAQARARDRRMLAAFKEARLRKIQLLIEPSPGHAQQGVLNNGVFSHASAADLFQSAFKEAGLDLDRMTRNELVHELRQRLRRCATRRRWP